MRLLPSLAALAIVAAGVGWWLTAPKPMPDSAFSGLTGDTAHGEQVFTAAGCASCHMAPGAEGEAQRVLGGGQRFASPFGTFLAPNISPDPTHGIGGWTLAQFGNAVMRGVSPEGEHYYPAFPYSAFNKMTMQDLADLKAFMDTLPPDATPSLPHEVGFPFNIRRSLGGWKLLFLRDDWVIDGTLSETETRGRYIAEALAHCGECHTPRNLLGGLERGRWLAGAPNPSGQGTIPNITPAKLGWSEGEIVEYLTSGFTPEFDSVGGHMAHVVENMSQLPDSDRQAVAAYLKKVPASE
ncbi:diacylglycerol kinase [Gemmobacter lutimaris]|uniref:Diacylglycerol kinase n=1 Tax=Gemmobacter lutimaris TaxID=2306023 RepID=A0A398BNV3_9RHOB|nr:cytochrome c [Gemmobacter lutimaris]RID91384.1 diacylglycerol kinase [Gemmobacter lutimaris]